MGESPGTISSVGATVCTVCERKAKCAVRSRSHFRIKTREVCVASPITTARNKYYENRKSNDIPTPEDIGVYLARIANKSLSMKPGTVIFDPAAGKGALLEHFQKELAIPEIPDYFAFRGTDLNRGRSSKGVYIDKTDYFAQVAQDWDRLVGLVVCNPPFNASEADKEYWRGHESKKMYGTSLIPDLFVRHTMQRFGNKTPMILFTPAGFVTNQRKKSARFSFYRQQVSTGGAQITGTCMLPLDTFPGVEFPMLVLFWNMPKVKPFYWMGELLHE